MTSDGVLLMPALASDEVFFLLVFWASDVVVAFLSDAFLAFLCLTLDLGGIS